MKFLPYYIYWLIGGGLLSHYKVCRNASSGEEGICISEWSCLHIAKGTVLGSCGQSESRDVCCKLKHFDNPDFLNEIQSLSNKSVVKVGNKKETVPYKIFDKSKSKREILVLKSLDNNTTPASEYIYLRSESVPQVFRKPVSLEESHNMRKPVELTHDFDLRRPLLPEESHDLRWPVLEEDTHDSRKPVSNFYSNIHEHSSERSVDINNFTTKISTPSTKLPPRNIEYDSGNPFVDGDEIPLNIIGCLQRVETEPGETSNEMLKESAQVCGMNQVQPIAKLVGGKTSKYMQWPWMVSLRQRIGYRFRHKCGATLLNSLWVITAAHCVKWQLTYNIRLRLGDYNLKLDDEHHSYVERAVERIIIHPKFSPITYENDVALLQMNAEVEFQPNILPVCLPKNVTRVEGKTGVVVGWGKVTQKGTLSGALQELHLPILSNHECEEMYSRIGPAENILDSFLCAGTPEGGSDACDGDSGGPMTIPDSNGRWSLIGLVSWGKECAAPNQPGVYTRITSVMKWIENIMFCFK